MPCAFETVTASEPDKAVLILGNISIVASPEPFVFTSLRTFKS